MFKHILVPTDGSELSRNAARAAIELARLSGARITALYVAPDYKLQVGEQSGMHNFVPLSDYEARMRQEAAPILASVTEVVAAAGLTSDAEFVMSDDPAHAIVHAATQHGCDTIVMGSHGHKGFRRALLGSVTQTVLVDSKIPVLVTR
jgi:nucleotide-binding universal stress UspA family protein